MRSGSTHGLHWFRLHGDVVHGLTQAPGEDAEHEPGRSNVMRYTLDALLMYNESEFGKSPCIIHSTVNF